MKATAMLRWTGTLAILSCILLVSGCAGWQSRSNPSPPNPVSAQSQPGTTPSPTSAAIRPIFYDFPDIPIPQELTIRPKDSYVFQTGQFKAGLLTLRGRVELNSLISFFQMALPRENWTPKGGFRYRRSVLIFEKPDKTCVINLYDKIYFTYVEILVAPAGGGI